MEGPAFSPARLQMPPPIVGLVDSLQFARLQVRRSNVDLNLVDRHCGTPLFRFLPALARADLSQKPRGAGAVQPTLKYADYL
jgi:hypothetical protein